MHRYLFLMILAGRRSNEIAAAFVVGYAGVGPHPSANAQQSAGRNDITQRTEIRPSEFRPAGCS